MIESSLTTRISRLEYETLLITRETLALAVKRPSKR